MPVGFSLLTNAIQLLSAIPFPAVSVCCFGVQHGASAQSSNRVLPHGSIFFTTYTARVATPFAVGKIFLFCFITFFLP